MEDFVHLVHDAQTGSPEAFGLLVARFQNMAYAYAYAVLSDTNLAQTLCRKHLLRLTRLCQPYGSHSPSLPG